MALYHAAVYPLVHMNPEVSIILLCYGLGEQIRKTVAEVEQVFLNSNVDYEIILVANYWESPSLSSIVATEVAKANPRIKAIATKKEGMYGWDVRAGVAASQGTYIVYCDGDGQFPFADILRVYRKLRDDASDLSTTYRTRREDPLWRSVISWVFNALFKMLFPGSGVIDVNAKPKALKRSLFSDLSLTSNDWFIDAEIVIQVKRRNLKVSQVPTVFNKLEGRRSLIKPSAILEFLKNLLHYWAKAN